MTEKPATRFGAKTILGVLLGVVVVVALLTPEAPTMDGGHPTSYSVGPNGVRIAFELAARLGWRTERRLVPLDSVASATTVQVVLAPNEALGAHEVHRLLDNVRRGGGLVFAIDGGEEIGDSLGIDLGRPARFLSNYGDASCATPSSFSERTLLRCRPRSTRSNGEGRRQVQRLLWQRRTRVPRNRSSSAWDFRLAEDASPRSAHQDCSPIARFDSAEPARMSSWRARSNSCDRRACRRRA